MYEKPFQLEIVTPEKVAFKDEATSLSLPGSMGGFQVLFNHAPLLSTLEIGELRVRDNQGKDHRFATSGGFVEVRENKAVVLVETAETSEDIDVARARRAEERARERLRVADPEIDVERARLALFRALNRQRIATR